MPMRYAKNYSKKHLQNKNFILNKVFIKNIISVILCTNRLMKLLLDSLSLLFFFLTEETIYVGK